MTTTAHAFREIAEWLRCGAPSRALEVAEEALRYANTFATSSTQPAAPKAEPVPSKPAGGDSTTHQTHED